MLRAMKLRRTSQPGAWRSADGRWLFSFWQAVRLWHVHNRDPNEPDGWSDEPATYDGFRTLYEATAWAAKTGREK